MSRRGNERNSDCEKGLVWAAQLVELEVTLLYQLEAAKPLAAAMKAFIPTRNKKRRNFSNNNVEKVLRVHYNRGDTCK